MMRTARPPSCPCDIAPAVPSGTYRLAAIDSVSLAEARADAIDARGAVMEGGKLLLVFLITLLIGQLISVSVGLLVERLASPYTGLVTFLACYFAMFWVAWRVAVRITAPHSRLGGSAPGQQEKASTARRADLSEAPSARR